MRLLIHMCFNNIQSMAVLLVLLLLLLLLAVPLTAFTTTDVYYVRADDAASHEQSCPPHKICHNLSYYIFQPDHYFTSDTTIIFLEGEHSFDKDDVVPVSNVHNLTLKGQGQWPVAGAEDTVMQSTAIIKCTKGRGGLYFATSHNITVEGLTVVNCGGVRAAVFQFDSVQSLLFRKNSIQHMTGRGLFVRNSDNVIITNCSYYHTKMNHHGAGGVGIEYKTQQYSNTGYTLELSHCNITKCGYENDITHHGGGLSLETESGFALATVILRNLRLSQNRADFGGNLGIILSSQGKVAINISNCHISHGYASRCGGGMYIVAETELSFRVENTNLVENYGLYTSEIRYHQRKNLTNSRFSLINSSIIHTETYSVTGIKITGFYSIIKIMKTKVILRKQKLAGFYVAVSSVALTNCQFERSDSKKAILYVKDTNILITNCTFSNNTGDYSVIAIDNRSEQYYRINILDSTISHNNMTGVTIASCSIKSNELLAHFRGHNVIQNNRNAEGAGIKMKSRAQIVVSGVLMLYNNTADKHGGAILVKHPFFSLQRQYMCTFSFDDTSSSVIFSGNRAGQGGSDMYGAILMGCRNGDRSYIPYIGHPNETSWYLDSPLMKHLHFSNNDRLSSMSSDPIMVCFCNTTTNLPDCSDRTHHTQTYPGLEINTSIATVGYYGGTSPGDVHVSAQHATIVRCYGQNQTTNCFQLHILLHQNTSSTIALVDIRVDGGLQGWSLSIGVDILECPVGFTKILGKCQCSHLLSNVQCLLSAKPFKFLRSGNSWFAYISNTQCLTGTTNCPFDYCNRSNVSFDIMAPDRQCLANRTGILCGQCQSHLSIMLGSNSRCGSCSNWYLFLLPVFAFTGMVLVAVLMFLNLSVSVGTINGLLFYANMVKINEAFFFPNGSVPLVSQFISWLNLDLGIEVCLINGLDGYWNTWLQFAFPAYLFLLMGCIIVGCRCSVWLCRLCGSHAVPALATLVFIPYTKILLTVTNALSMSRLPCNDSILTVWSVDGNIKYGSGKHLILVVFSCGVLVIGVAYSVLVLCAPLLERYSDKCIPQHRWNPVAKFKPLLDAYGGPYKDKYRFWTGVTLMVRLIVIVVSSFFNSPIFSASITAIVVGIIVLWSLTDCVYKQKYLSALEAFFLLNIILLSIVSLSLVYFQLDYQIATIVSVCLSVTSCLFCYHGSALLAEL